MTFRLQMAKRAMVGDHGVTYAAVSATIDH